MDFSNFAVPYKSPKAFQKRVAYFSMEFAIDQALKIYSGGLGFLAGSHMRSAYEAKQNLIGIGLLWKYGYYDQGRNPDLSLQVQWNEKNYSFLQDTGIKFQVSVHHTQVWVKAYYLAPEVFGSAPMFLLSTDLPENDYLARTITHKLYDSHPSAKVAQFLLLGIGGAKLLDLINWTPEVYHLNEAHAAPSIFYLLDKHGSLEEVGKRLVFTTHTPEEAGNEKHELNLCYDMGYFYNTPLEQVKSMYDMNDGMVNHSLIALRTARKANAVSKLHGDVSRKMWGKYSGICEIDHVTNSQNYTYWADQPLYDAINAKDNKAFDSRKKALKAAAFAEVADQCGKIFDPNALTIVWARRFAGYKRADLITRNLERFSNIINDKKRPVQIIWAGKPYPLDIGAVADFNKLVEMSKSFDNMAVVTGYELELSRKLKQASDVWLNTPRVPREASGTSGMTAAMNGSINFSTDDGWICEFAVHDKNSFIIPQADYENTSTEEQDIHDLSHLLDILENDIIPMYYDQHSKWRSMNQQGMKDVIAYFTSERMAKEYYEKMYS